MKRHLIVFAKRPRQGRVKSRLARDIGPVAAWGFYRQQLDRLLRRLGRDPRWVCWLALSPDPAVRDRGWPKGWRRIGQGQGDLGRRMIRALGQRPPGPAVLIGSDIPDIDGTHIAAAFERLRRHEAVLGPSGDGGYWLIGFRRTGHLPALDGVRWSTAQALADTRARIGSDIGCVATLEDIDTGADLARWKAGRKTS